MRKVLSISSSSSSFAETSIKERHTIIRALSDENNRMFKKEEPLSKLIHKGILCISLKGLESDQIERFKTDLKGLGSDNSELQYKPGGY